MPQPMSLQKLSLKAFADYFFNLSISLHPISPGCKPKKKKRRIARDEQKVKQTLKNLHRYLIENVPTALVNRVTDVLLHCLNRVMESQIKWYTVSRKQEIFFNDLLQSILHPAVSRLESANYYKYSDIFPYSARICYELRYLLIKSVKSLTNLKALHLNIRFEEINLLDFEFPSGLEELTMSCSDEELAKFASSCKLLKILNLHTSHVITNASIDVLLNMEHLERLRIPAGCMTDEDTAALLSGLVKKGEACKLKFLKFSHYTTQHLKILESLPNIKICLGNDYFDQLVAEKFFKVPDLYNLKNLHELHIVCRLADLNDLVRKVGSQLSVLGIRIDDGCHVGIENLMTIGLYCTSLMHLRITGSVVVSPDIQTYPREQLAGFYSVSCLTLTLSSLNMAERDILYYMDMIYFLVSQCVNAKRLTLPEDSCNKLRMVSELLERGCLKNVEQMFFQPCSSSFELPCRNRDQEAQVLQMLKYSCLNLQFCRRIKDSPLY